MYGLSSVFVVEDGTTLSSDATLSALTVNDGTDRSTPSHLATTPYTVDVGNDVMEVTLTATTTHTGASVSAVTLGGTRLPTTDFTDGITVPSLAEGDNVIDVTVTAEDGSATETYTVTVTREATTTTVPGAPTSLTATANGSSTDRPRLDRAGRATAAPPSPATGSRFRPMATPNWSTPAQASYSSGLGAPPGPSTAAVRGERPCQFTYDVQSGHHGRRRHLD